MRVTIGRRIFKGHYYLGIFSLALGCYYRLGNYTRDCRITLEYYDLSGNKIVKKFQNLYVAELSEQWNIATDGLK